MLMYYFFYWFAACPSLVRQYCWVINSARNIWRFCYMSFPVKRKWKVYYINETAVDQRWLFNIFSLKVLRNVRYLLKRPHFVCMHWMMVEGSNSHCCFSNGGPVLVNITLEILLTLHTGSISHVFCMFCKITGMFYFPAAVHWSIVNL